MLPEPGHRLVLGVEVAARVELLVPQEFEGTAAQRVRPRPGGHVDQRRGLAAELRGVLRLLDLELLHRLRRRVDHQVVEQLVGHLDAVQQVDVVARALAADVGQGTGLLQGFAAGPARRQDHGVAQQGQPDDVAGIQRHPQDLLVRHDVADLGARHLKQLGVARNRHRLVESSELEHEIQLQSIAQRGDDVGASRAREAGELDGHGVRPHTQ